jgi:hypothetical protein
VCGYDITHWLNRKPVEPAGKYIRVVRSAPPVVRFMDRKFVFGEEAHSHYVAYTPAAEAELKSSGASVSIVEISYQLRGEVY